MKRILDIFAALTGLLLLALPLALIALAIYLDDRHSPFYRGVRVGRGCREFRMLKFRTMILNASKTGVHSTAAGDARITPIGRLLRATKLDELPQLWNVVTGKMSLVGPRPQVLPEVRLYTIEECRLLDVRPGITDLASIVFSDEAQILAGSADPDLLYNQIIRPWKNRLALAQIARPSVLTDLRVIGLTLLSAVSRRAALQRIDALLRSWGAAPELRRVASRREELPAAAPPGAHTIVSSYPRAEAAQA
jgi:lipopolysaccharide/colanic/teichoic acid biosynthesis glycosyltransferase